ncbi:D-tagatose-1,6-bisphosphate aldolase subunit GatY [Burkholderia lata]|uniref:class II fructose-bisphosphate aldolase n=1 Tax=Burkholderia lata (strain ATCC 17760 / DSM 23089 / LMG 22485 / NCIMB 9086 / R18194 / 383) TaxID=482957 RepID=UPI001452BAFC|nr:class II fructose-bisphosphate aldolase [Burkholderia lata]VWC10461.1 D-tagatose-1,6-bisphosphate aldolase subunit GatY [Burkholderia lata]
MTTYNPGKPAYAIFDHVTWRDGQLREKFTARGLTPVRSPSGHARDILGVTPEQYACLVVLDGMNRRGIAGYEWMMQKVAELREMSPSIGVVFVNEATYPLRAQAMPHMTWATGRDDLDLDAILHAVVFQKSETNAAYRDWGFPLSASAHRESASDTGEIAPVWTETVPNYNLKHLSMLVPLALASRERNGALYCEISPQEALTYCRVPYQRDTRKMVMSALDTVRAAVSQVNRELGSKLLLHLDHCDDLRIIDHAASIGFDSIMADGSARSLEQNIAFVRKAKSITSRYPVSLEGEVGHIDGNGPRRWNRTRPDDLVRFLEETGVDYVGVHVGQFHGFSYDYQRSRAHHAAIYAARESADANDWPAFIHACQELDEALDQLGISRTSEERKILAHCATLSLDGHPTAPASVAGLLGMVGSTGTFRIQPLLSELEARWLQRRVSDVRQRNARWREIFQGVDEEKRTGYARVDWDLLSDLSGIAARNASALVIHGGSSIHDDDLRLLGHDGVARVNFGTQIFADYLTHLAAEHTVDASKQLASHLGTLTFLDEYAEQWESWLNRPPAGIVAFSARIVAKHLSLFASSRTSVSSVTSLALSD